MARALQAAGVRVVVRSLPLGDMMWVVTAGNSVDLPDGSDPTSVRGHDQPADEAEEEYVCPYIVERKTAADLRASISDARYKEQKYRLAVCATVALVVVVFVVVVLLLPLPLLLLLAVSSSHHLAPLSLLYYSPCSTVCRGRIVVSLTSYI